MQPACLQYSLGWDRQTDRRTHDDSKYRASITATNVKVLMFVLQNYHAPAVGEGH